MKTRTRASSEAHYRGHSPATGHSSPPIDLSDWEWGVDHEGLSKIIGETANAVINEVFQHDPPRLYLGNQYDENIDPLTVILSLPLGATEDDPLWSMSIKKMVDDLIELYWSPRPGFIADERGQTICRKTAAALRALADVLDQSLIPPSQQPATLPDASR